MAGKIIIDTERCKGCGLCVVSCPQNSIVISEKSNKNGYFPAQPVPSVVEGTNNTDCTGCAMCAVICPEAIIEVQCDDNIGTPLPNKKLKNGNILAIEPEKKSKADLLSLKGGTG